MGTIGHNVMVWAEDPAYALWFMIGSHDREKVAEFWAKNGSSIDDDNYFMPVEASLFFAPTLTTISLSPPTNFPLAETPRSTIHGVCCKTEGRRLCCSASISDINHNRFGLIFNRDFSQDVPIFLPTKEPELKLFRR